MQKLLRFIFSLAWVFGLIHSAHAEFISIHSYASTSVTTPNSATPIVLGGNFQSMYAPTGVSGCSIGVTDLRSLCSQPGYGALQLQFPGYGFPSINEVKIYIPAGTMRFTLVASMPQGAIAAAALRMDTAPTRIAELSSAEYSATQAAMKQDLVFKQLLAGAEVIQTHDGGGTFTIAWGYANGSNSQYVTPTGRWLYIRFINFADLYQVMGSTLVNLTAYQTGYTAIQWDTNGDPVDTGSSAVTPTTPTTPITPAVTPLSGITLSTSSLLKGSASTVTIAPLPSNASLGTCTSSPANLVSINGNTISLAAGANAITTATPVTITCGSVSQTLTIVPNTVPLTGITLSQNSLVSTDATTRITLAPSPVGATIPATCKVFDGTGTESNLVTALSSSGTSYGFTILTGTANLVKLIGQNQVLSVDCGGGVKSTFVITLPLTVTPNPEAGTVNNITSLDKLTDLTFTFTPSLPTGVSAADLYIFVYVPAIPISQFGAAKTVPLYGYQVKNGYTKVNGTWTSISNQLLPILFTPPEAYQPSTSSGVSMKVSLGYGVTGSVAASVKAEYYVAYLPAGTTDWAKLQFIGDKQGSFSGIPAFWKP
ncbi:MAG: hypothetical protein RIR79_1326 [Pseudomonadota bacterium]|jgi:hypothetical protein